MTELEPYWRKFIDARVAEEYYFLYSHLCRRTVWSINAICLVLTGTGVAAWLTERLHPLAASLLILIVQSVGLLQPLFPFQDRLYASRYLYREYTNLASEAEKAVTNVILGHVEEKSLSEKLNHIVSEMENIEDKFSTSDLFPRNKRLHKRAQKSVLQYVNVHFDLED